MTTTATKRPRTKPAEERREDLMNAAERLFLDQGVVHTTIEQITSGADVSKGTFYLYFSTKEDIHAALGDRFITKYVEELNRAIARPAASDWAGKLSAWAKSGVSGFFDNGPLVHMLFHAYPQPSDWTRHNPVLVPLENLLRDGVADGAWNVPDIHFMAVFLYSGLHGIVDDALYAAKRPKRNHLVKKLEQVCFGVLNMPIPEGSSAAKR